MLQARRGRREPLRPRCRAWGPLRGQAAIDESVLGQWLVSSLPNTPNPHPTRSVNMYFAMKMFPEHCRGEKLWMTSMLVPVDQDFTSSTPEG